MGRLTDAKEFNDLVIATRNGSPIRVRDIGWAEDGTKEQRSLARLNGVPTVVLEVRRQSGANTVEVIEAGKSPVKYGKVDKDRAMIHTIRGVGYVLRPA